MNKTHDFRIILITILSGLFEYYDFIIFVLMSKILSKLFLNNNETIAYSIMLSSGYFARFFGGIIFGYLSEKTGINKTFSMTIFLMLLSCILISILPTYNQIGYLSIFIIFFTRMIQGASLGGELPLSLVFSIKNCSKKINPYFISSTLFFGLTLGTLLANLVLYLLNKLFTIEQIYYYAWKIPFLFGGFLMLIAIFMRRGVFKKEPFKGIATTKNIGLLKLDKMKLTIGFLIVSPPTLLYNIVYFQTPVFLSQKHLFINEHDKYFINIGIFLTGLFSIILTIFYKYYKKIHYNCLLMSIIYLPILIYLLYSEDKIYMRASFVLFSVPLSILFSGIYAFLFYLFEDKFKVLYIALSINFSNIIFASSSYIIIELFDKYFSVFYFALYIVFIFILSLFTLNKMNFYNKNPFYLPN